MVHDYIIGLDKLELTLKPRSIYTDFNDLFAETPIDLFCISSSFFQNVYEFNGYVLTNRNKQTQTYNMTYEVKYEGFLIGYLFLDNRNSNYNNYIGFKIYNGLLYNPECRNILIDFLRLFNAEINNYSAIDIFIDSRSNMWQMFIDNLNNKENIRFNSKIKNFDYCGSHNIETLFVPNELRPSFYFGSKKTGKQAIIYNKTTELELSKKEYILELHNISLTENINDVYRFELRLLNTYLKSKKYVISLDMLFDTDFLKTIVRESLPNFFEFRENTDVRITRCKPIPFFDLCTKADLKVRDGLSPCNNDSHKTKTTSKPNISDKKGIIKKMIKDAANDYNAAMFPIIKQVAISYDLYDFYENEIRYIDFIKPKPIPNTNILNDSNFWNI